MATTNVLEQPYINITNIIWSFDHATNQVNILLVKRDNAPYRNFWALPETFMRFQESADDAALRLVKEKKSAWNYRIVIRSSWQPLPTSCGHPVHGHCLWHT